MMEGMNPVLAIIFKHVLLKRNLNLMQNRIRIPIKHNFLLFPSCIQGYIHLKMSLFYFVDFNILSVIGLFIEV